MKIKTTLGYHYKPTRLAKKFIFSLLKNANYTSIKRVKKKKDYQVLRIMWSIGTLKRLVGV